ncbi:hypothetical protein [Haploplasma modicum]|uniref:hypothetical protein n=1 Tax=Haploplasma modicum TaxID=2150 RepID=UPI00047D004F|nr:hypothetical protein [Haploplasma modicum]
MSKKILFTFVVLLLTLTLVGCKKDFNFEKAFNDKNNYEVSVEVIMNSTVEANVELKFDGNKSSFKDENESFIFVKNENKVTTYEKAGETWKKSDETLAKNDAFAFYLSFKNELFIQSENKGEYNLKEESLEEFNKYFKLNLENYKVESIKVVVEKGLIKTINVELTSLSHDLEMILNFSNYNEVMIEVPTI